MVRYQKGTVTDYNIRIGCCVELKLTLDTERSKIEAQAEKLRIHEKELLTAQEQMRKKEVEVGCKVQDVRIKMENKYRVML